MNYPHSKQPNPSKFHHNNRFLLPFHSKKIVGERKKLANVPDRKPGQIIKSNDGKHIYEVQMNDALRKLPARLGALLP